MGLPFEQVLEACNLLQYCEPFKQYGVETVHDLLMLVAEGELFDLMRALSAATREGLRNHDAFFFLNFSPARRL